MRFGRNMRRCGLAIAVWLLASSSAHALELRIGAKVALTLSGFIGVEPHADLELPPWHASSAGAGYGGGLYFDLHFTKLISLELDALFESNHVYFEGVGEPDGVATYLEQRVDYGQLRLPLLFKLVAHLGEHVEFTGALGPEVLIGLGADQEWHVYDGQEDVMRDAYFSEPASGFALSAAFGFGFLTKYLHIPIELRFGYNLLGPYSYGDRVKSSTSEQGQDIYTLRAIENFQFAVLLGLGFRIPPEQPPAPPRPVKPVVEVDDPFYYPPPDAD